MIALSQNIKNRKLWCSLILIIFLIPTYFIHTQKYPDWGDDFAQYVYQGQQINTPSGTYKQVLNVDGYSSPKRSLFFSVVLSVIHPTIQIKNYVNLISISYILAAVCFFLFLSSYYSLTISVIGTLCVFYNFLFLRLKSEVVPEFLFISLFYLILYLTFSAKNWVKYIIPVLLGLLVSIRFVGLSLLLGYVIFLLFSKDKTFKQKIMDVIICLLIFVLIVTFINNFFISTITNHEVKLYGSFVFDEFNLNVLYTNISIYLRYLTLFFEQEIPFWMNLIMKIGGIISIIIGLVLSFKNKKTIINYCVVFYFLFLFVFPYNGDTIKYLIPIFPLIFYFFISGVNFVLDIIFSKKKEIVIAGCLSIVLLSNSKTIWLAINQEDNKIGPYELSVLDDFSKVKQIVNSNENIAFGKPFVINLLCDRHSYFVSQKNYKEVFSKADYFLAPKPNVQELYSKNINFDFLNGDTTELNNFYLIKL